jgi:hypothetical protein
MAEGREKLTPAVMIPIKVDRFVTVGYFAQCQRLWAGCYRGARASVLFKLLPALYRRAQRYLN